MPYTFRDAHRPVLEAGAYALTVFWSIGIDGESPEAGEEKADFWVAGERFSFNPSDIQAMYPPAGSRGDYSDSLPHIALARDTLPWERSAKGADAPWLALLLLNADEAAACPVQTISLGAYLKKLPDRVRGSFQLEYDQAESHNVQVIEPPSELLRDVLPNLKELSRLCHVRAAEDNVAVVAGKRLPYLGQNTVHLVALENRYLDEEFHTGGQSTCALVSLKSWTFTCEPPGSAQTESLDVLFEQLDVAWLQLPASTNGMWAYPSLGFVPLAHRFRTGESGVSWYAGALVPSRTPIADDGFVALPAGAADELLWYDEAIGMLNVTYAAAWELGRLLAMQNRRVFALLYNWRRQHIGHAHAVAAASDDAHRHIPQVQSAAPRAPVAPPGELTAWIDSLRWLRGIPYNYLIPDERMLPPESIRFFFVDPLWIRALFDGVLSSVRAPTDCAAHCRDAEKSLMDGFPDPRVTGFLLRSAAVTGWPGLEVVAKGSGADPLSLCRREQLSPSVMLYLFQGQVTSITIEQRFDTVHLSVEDHKNDPSIWRNKSRRVLDATALNVTSGSGFAQTWLHKLQILDIPVQW
jgi:hypothetical protein